MSPYQRAHLAYHLREVAGTIEEFLDMPCDSLRQRALHAIRRAQLHLDRIEESMV